MQKILENINKALEAGKTIYVATHGRITVISPKVAKAWADTGRPMFKVGKDENLYMAKGKKYVCLSCAGRLLVGLEAH